jgi:hypothetical protein
MIPWDAIGAEIVGDLLQLPEVAVRMGQKDVLEGNMGAMMLLGKGGPGQNGVPTAAAPPELPTEQLAGNISETA